MQNGEENFHNMQTTGKTAQLWNKVIYTLKVYQFDKEDITWNFITGLPK